MGHYSRPARADVSLQYFQAAMLALMITVIVVTGVALSSAFVLYERKSPSATMAWILAIFFLPFIGLFTYFVFGRRRVNMRVQLRKAIREKVGDIWEVLDFDGSLKAAMKATEDNQGHHDLMLLAYRFPGLPPTLGNRVQVLPDADAAYHAIFDAVAGAKEHIHALYYIIKPDATGRRFRDALVDKARQGVEVRVLYDDIGSDDMDLEFFRPLIEAGGKVREFRPVAFSRFRTFYANFRNHRKVIVVDGQKAFTGGINIGDEYLGLDPEVGFWRDTHVMITGRAASHLQLVFAEDWYYVTGELLTGAYARPEEPAVGGAIVQVVPSGPDRQTRQVAQMYFTAITSARNRLYISTPYFIPDEAVQAALIAASMRGVDVRLLVPHKSDTKVVTYASRSYYRELLAAGCRIYEYKKGFMHAKTMTADGQLGIVGTANLDIRSFQLNFEVCAICYDASVAEALDRQFMADLKDAERVKLSTFSKRPRVDVFLENTARLMSSIL